MRSKNHLKVKGVSKSHRQTWLADVGKGDRQIRRVTIARNTVLLEDMGLETLSIGTLRTEDARFLESLHGYELTPLVTGGGWIITNEHGKQEKTVSDLSDLREDEQVLISEGAWSATRKNHGLLLTPKAH